ncbi:MAG: hypothetical protein ABIP61_02810 [Burkholderiaceae bacterium]
MNFKPYLIASAAAALFSAGVAHAASSTTPAGVNTTAAATPRVDASSGDTKDMLEQKLKAGQNRADYAKIIEQNGWRVSAINADKPDYLEYEIVKDKHSYEVHLDFKDGAQKASDIDVTTNMWRADSTKRMEKDKNYKPASPLVADNTGKYSDRTHMKAWNDEKEKLEAALPPNMKAADYKKKLQEMGYKITSVNDRKSDYVEYEIVKGNNSYEVQIDRDPKTQLATKVDVATNAWDAEGTERAKDASAHKAKKM